MATFWKINWNWWQICLCPHMYQKSHSNHAMKLKMTVKEPPPWIIGLQSKHNVTIVGHSNSILERRCSKITLNQIFSIEIEHMFQINLFDGAIWRSTNSNNVVSIAMQMKWMTQVNLLNCNHNEANSIGIIIITVEFHAMLTFINDNDFYY